MSTPVRVSIFAVGPDDDHERELWENALSAVVRDNAYCLGKYVQSFEERVQEQLDVPHAIGVSSGTDGLRLGLQAAGVRAGDEVIVPAFSFFATASVVAHLGATPVFVDVSQETLTLDVGGTEAAITERTRAIVPVHLYGQAADMDAILALAERRGISVVEDAAQAFGVRHRGRALGSLGSGGMFSFYPTKNLGAPGDAGMYITRNDDVAATVRALRVHGDGGGYQHTTLGWNARMDGFCAAVLSVRLERLSRIQAARESNAALYEDKLLAAGLLDTHVPLGRTEGSDHGWHQFVLRCPRRDDLRGFLLERGIQTGVYYPIPLPHLPAFADRGHREGEFPVAEQASRETLALPVHHRLTPDDIDLVVQSIGEF